jgi:hypothetical protein
LETCTLTVFSLMNSSLARIVHETPA